MHVEVVSGLQQYAATCTQLLVSEELPTGVTSQLEEKQSAKHQLS